MKAYHVHKTVIWMMIRAIKKCPKMLQKPSYHCRKQQTRVGLEDIVAVAQG